MKYTIINTLIALSLTLLSLKLGWYPAGQEAIASAGQVLNGDEYTAARLEMQFWNTVSQWISYGALVFFGLAAWCLAKSKNLIKTNKQ